MCNELFTISEDDFTSAFVRVQIVAIAVKQGIILNTDFDAETNVNTLFPLLENELNQLYSLISDPVDLEAKKHFGILKAV